MGGGTHPGKFKASFGVCLIPYGTGEQPVSTYTLVVTRWPSSASFGLSAVPVTFPAGRDSDGAVLSVCRGQIGAARLPGRFKPATNSCYVGVNGTMMTVQPYDILTSPPSRPF